VERAVFGSGAKEAARVAKERADLEAKMNEDLERAVLGSQSKVAAPAPP
jgi:hypothetical protein